MESQRLNETIKASNENHLNTNLQYQLDQAKNALNSANDNQVILQQEAQQAKTAKLQAEQQANNYKNQLAQLEEKLRQAEQDKRLREQNRDDP